MKIDIQAILAAIAAYPDGASLQDLIENIPAPPTRRTLQRHLAALVAAQQIAMVGKKSSTRYLLPKNDQINDYPVSLSTGGKALQQRMRSETKTPVGYHRAFLDAYEPNITYYLSEKERQQLRTWGTPAIVVKQSGTFVKKILHHLMIDLSWNSSRLEGNTYSLLETERLLESGTVAENKNPLDAQMLLNHKAAIEFLVDQAESLTITAPTILNLHALLADNLLSDPAACGRLRTIPVGIAKTVYSPSKIPQLIQECFSQIINKAAVIQDPYEQSFFLTVHLPYLQAFEDVNKRVSRLAANIPFIRENLCPLSFIDVPESAYIEGMLGVYELNRIDLLKDIYTWAYERSCQKYSTILQVTGTPDPVGFQYRSHIAQLVNMIIRQTLNKAQAIAAIQTQANASIPPEDRARFIEIIDKELMGLHFGNIARFKLTAEQFERWHQQW